ncbi:hypothetical protein BGZ83_003099, partial [Gryganskiella cystojenkinii]
MRTWIRKIYDTKTRNTMTEAMHKKTRIGCEALVKRAIERCPLQSIKDYITRYYLPKTEKWALWSRQHSPLLLQVTTTNPLESYHSELKRVTSKHYGFIGASIRIAEVDDSRKARSKKAENDFRTKSISLHNVPDDVLRGINRLPFPIQNLIAGEANAMSTRIEKGKLPPELDGPECDCLFFHKYYMPCRHILHAHIFGNQDPSLLTDDAWKVFHSMFEESGFEVYQSYALMDIPLHVETPEEVKTEERRLKVNELLERARNTFWEKLNSGNEDGTDLYIEDLE